MTRILLIEDDKALNRGIVLALKTAENTIEGCYSLADAIICIEKNDYDLVILDVNLPDGNGLDFLTELKQKSITPIILLTANDLETDIVAGLELGADDYITKPFSLMVLRARVNNQLRKLQSGDLVYRDRRFNFDFKKMLFYVDDKQIDLSLTEQKLLRVFVNHKGQNLLREQLIESVWSQDATFVEENALSVTVKRLRDKLEKDPKSPTGIKTLYGIGYKWEGY